MSISEITGIPRPTVVRKLKHLIDNNFLSIDEKKLLESKYIRKGSSNKQRSTR